MQDNLLPQSFFERPSLEVSTNLLGKRLVRILDDGTRLAGIISEVEAYIGEDDPASHAARGRTKRTEIMYGPAGRAYIYLIYGMYDCLNVVTESAGFPAALLIRSIVPEEGSAQMRLHTKKIDSIRYPLASLTNGPGKLCQALAISRQHNGLDLTTHSSLFFEDTKQKPTQIITTPRIGIRVGTEKPWRFLATFPPL